MTRVIGPLRGPGFVGARREKPLHPNEIQGDDRSTGLSGCEAHPFTDGVSERLGEQGVRFYAIPGSQEHVCMRRGRAVVIGRVVGLVAHAVIQSQRGARHRNLSTGQTWGDAA